MSYIERTRTAVNKKAAREAAKEYRQRGWKVIPVPGNSKSPVETGWPTRTFNDDQDFPLWSNIGVQFGAVSGGLCDVDIDCPEVLAIADRFLPETNAEFGRLSKPRAHRLYKSDLHMTEDKATIQFTDPTDGAMLLELRIGGGGKGAQTMFPPSRHPDSGEDVYWDTNGDPVHIPGDKMKQGAYDCATAALLIRHYPGCGSRENAALALGGVLARAQFNADDLAAFVRVVAHAAGDDEVEKRVVAAVAAIGRLSQGEKTQGIPSLAKIWGEKVADRVAEWLGLKSTPRQKEREGDTEKRPLIARRIDSFERRSVSWFWYPFIPLGMVTTLIGDGEVGKSTVTTDLAARLSRGKALPHFGDDRPIIQDGSSIILTKEDDISRIVRPRLEAAEADLSRVYTLGYDAPDDPDNFDPLATLEGMVSALQQKIDDIGDVKLIVIDPITDYVGNIDIYKENQVRDLLQPLTRLAARNNLAVIIILHFNKKTDQPAKYRGMGSVAFRNVPRSVLVIGLSQDNPDRRLLMQEKRNLTAEKRSVMFGFHPVRGYARIDWDRDWQDVDNVDDVLNGKKQAKQEQAIKLLRDELTGRRRVLSDDIAAMARDQGISNGTMRLARVTLGVKTEKHGARWWCWLPPPESGATRH